MTPQRYREMQKIFLAACDRADEERTAFLGEVCRDDPELGGLVRALLAGDAQDGGVLRTLDGLPRVVDCRGPGDEDQPGIEDALPDLDHVGRYVIRGVLGEGGMGIVYDAEQENPRRRVALKVIRSGVASKSTLRRFQHEADVLGRLQHPGIAQIFEAGATQTRYGKQPFFAMELVRGRPITEYAKSAGLGIQARLELVVKVCRAVEHAHQKGVIHRDLKPANILVVEAGDAEGPAGTKASLGGGVGQPKILDFGVARAVDADIQTTTLRTEIGQVIGTVPYMSPEQLRGDSALLSVRSDVYALGVLAYELLTDCLPYKLAGKTLPEAARVIEEDDPVPLSTVDSALRGDLNTVVLKALEKEPSRRYQSVSELAADIERYLDNQPIAARPSTGFYQFRKLVTRHKVAFALLTTVMLVLAGATIWVSVLYARAQSNLTRAIHAEGASREQAEIAERVSMFLVGLLQLGDRDQNRAGVSAEDILTREIEKVRTELSEAPLIQAELFDTLGRVFCNRGRYNQAEVFFRDSLAIWRRQHSGPRIEIADSLRGLARVMAHQGRLKAGQSLLAEAVSIHRQLGGAHRPAHAMCLNDSARILRDLGFYADAERLYRQALGIGKSVTGEFAGRYAFSESLCGLAVVLADLGEYDQAKRLARQGLAIRRRILGNTHPRVAAATVDFASILTKMGAHGDAETLVREGLAIYRRAFGDEHANVGRAQQALATILQQASDSRCRRESAP